MKRFVLLSDVHARFLDLVDSLIAAGIVRANLSWRQADHEIWIVGDFVDRCQITGEDELFLEEFKMACAVRVLNINGRSSGCRVRVAVGNHELYNTVSDVGGAFISPLLLSHMTHLYGRRQRFFSWQFQADETEDRVALDYVRFGRLPTTPPLLWSMIGRRSIDLVLIDKENRVVAAHASLSNVCPIDPCGWVERMNAQLDAIMTSHVVPQDVRHTLCSRDMGRGMSEQCMATLRSAFPGWLVAIGHTTQIAPSIEVSGTYVARVDQGKRKRFVVPRWCPNRRTWEVIPHRMKNAEPMMAACRRETENISHHATVDRLKELSHPHKIFSEVIV